MIESIKMMWETSKYLTIRIGFGILIGLPIMIVGLFTSLPVFLLGWAVFHSGEHAIDELKELM